MIPNPKASGLVIKAAAAAGLLLSALICAVLIAVTLRPRGAAPEGGGFHRLLEDYDRIFGAGEQEKDGAGGRPETPAAMLDRLDKIEKNVQGVESWLSLLKRRRALAKAYPRMTGQYQDACRRAAAAFPWSEPLAALALSLPGSAESRDHGALINNTRFIPLALAAAVLRGDFDSPGRAAENRGENLLSLGLPLIRSGLPAGMGDRLIVNLVLLKILKGDYPGAEAQLQGLSRNAGQGAFLGEYYYDFGDPLRAAEMFNRTGGEGGLLRSADALWLGGKNENAGNIWRTLISAAAGPEARLRSLYNLGASFPEDREKWFTLLHRAGEEDPALRGNPAYVYGFIGYTRYMGPYEALELLDSRLRSPEDSPALAALRDLEILRRRGELWPPERTVAETWLLLDRYPGDPRLYSWAAWYFDYQRRGEEGAILIKTAGYRNIREPRLDLSAALNDLAAGRLDEAEKGLRSIVSTPAGRQIWQAEANLGLIAEARRAPAEALEHYEMAAGGVKDRQAASRLQRRIAGCLRSLGRKEESRRVLRYSLDLDSGNLAARLELRRLEEAEEE